jgi:hypothetical protein
VTYIDTKLIRINKEDYQKLRNAAFFNESKMKTVFSEIMSGQLDPTQIKIMQQSNNEIMSGQLDQTQIEMMQSNNE